MKNLELLFAFVVGVFLGVIMTWGDRVMDGQRGYTQGRESVLSRVVTIGEPASPCRLDIPLSVLAEMVSMGAVQWHERCEALILSQGENQ
jgi:hypothetical protein